MAQGVKVAPDHVFAELKSILNRYARRLNIVEDRPTSYTLETRAPSYRGKPLVFACTRVQKNYVSFYLMPLYMYPELGNTLSPELLQRRQGKSCFNFKQPDQRLFAELAGLTEAGFKRYEAAKLL